MLFEDGLVLVGVGDADVTIADGSQRSIRKLGLSFAQIQDPSIRQCWISSPDHQLPHVDLVENFRGMYPACNRAPVIQTNNCWARCVKAKEAERALFEEEATRL